ncbi:glutamyl-tRNA(Gln) amidotransferase subunit C, mitochondrial-like [Anopheles maculipalpis]|uniref:glutamyl-tRNA(Gln) amidotransferase subunit C, mitochondrial n=1 Tax=Anopheles maculipalpis TaxID=1496333 RepID=UPI0021596099|nr:glutamyl-tRNA(Gln) amidotransferase subunit C, mitochondrial [Anopheles maculipalpis]XP_050074061.1 glutamyl-tRNA(Gln) amidotransferase subunit C, mitochondrial-like [Anopheles maculipalpis]
MLRSVLSRFPSRNSLSTLQASPQSPKEARKWVSRNWPGKPLQHPTKVPQQPHRLVLLADPSSITINQQTVQLLERLSLVNLDSKQALETLQDSIEFASRIIPIDTDDVEPLYSVLEREKLALRTDTVDDGDRQTEVLQNAALVEEEYFVAPPGNIPLEQAGQSYL